MRTNLRLADLRQTTAHQRFTGQNRPSHLYIYDTDVYLGKDRKLAAPHLTATQATTTNLTREKKELVINCTWSNYFPDLFDELSRKKITVVGL
jgi:hypothetical protein